MAAMATRTILMLRLRVQTRQRRKRVAARARGRARRHLARAADGRWRNPWTACHAASWFPVAWQVVH